MRLPRPLVGAGRTCLIAAVLLLFGYHSHDPEAVVVVNGEGRGGDDDNNDDVFAKLSRVHAGGLGVRNHPLSEGGSGKEENDVLNGDRWSHAVSRAPSLDIGMDASPSYNAFIPIHLTSHPLQEEVENAHSFEPTIKSRESPGHDTKSAGVNRSRGSISVGSHLEGRPLKGAVVS